MKRALIVMLVGILVFGPGKPGIAQQSDEEKARQEEAYKRQEEQKKAQEAEMKARKKMLEQQRLEVMKEHEHMLKERTMELEHLEDIMKDMKVDVRMPDEGVYVIANEYDWFQNSQTQLTLRNSFRGGSDSSTGSFDVEEGTRRIKCMINGKVRSGSITIKILYPGGKVFKELTITSSAEITFSQSLNIKEDKQEKYVGSWKYEIKATKAEGNYMLSVSTS